MRWFPTILMMLVTVVSYVDRSILSLLAPTILRENHLTNEQYGWMVSAFSLTYLVFNLVWGQILDRFGLRVSMVIAVTVWTVASVYHSFASGFRSFLAARALLGVGEGATFPACLRTVVQSLPFEVHSRGVAIAYSGASIGAAITPLVITPIVAAYGWQAGFWFTGLVGLWWLVLWIVLSGRYHFMPVAQRGKTPSLKWTDPRIWAFLAGETGAFPQAIVIYWGANYLSSLFHKGQTEIGYVLWLPPLGWEVGYFFWGWIVDRLLNGGRSIPAMRKQFVLLLILSLTICVTPQIKSFPLTLAMMFASMFVSSGFIICGTAYATCQLPDHPALIGGTGAACSAALGIAIMPIFGHLFDLHLYQEVFLLAALFPVGGVITWVFLTRNTAAQGRQFVRMST